VQKYLGKDKAEIKKLVEKGEMTRVAGKKVLTAVFESDVDVDAFCEENGLNSKVDEGFILETVRKVIAENEKIVADYKGGKVKALQALFGSVMRELRGTGDPAVIRSLLEAEVNK
jgi:aspartyl-tRNA(Asn)/glutamyl-tRNA(Gln) amidotransferase subunit B